MNLFDRFIAQTTSAVVGNDRSSQLIALSCYTIAKKLRHNSSLNNENEKTSFIFETENYRDEEIFVSEQRPARLIFAFFFSERRTDRGRNLELGFGWFCSSRLRRNLTEENLLGRRASESSSSRSHSSRRDNLWYVDESEECLSSNRMLSSLELNTLTLLPSLLACASLKAAMKGLRLTVQPPLDDLLIETIHCQRVELIHSQCLIEQLFQSCLQEIVPSPPRRCLVPIDSSPQQRTKVK